VYGLGSCLCAGSSNGSASFFYFCLPFELNDVGTGCCCFVGYQETEVEGVHLALALAYHGLLRIPTRAETSDMTPRR
jgi:hypothetical protein